MKISTLISVALATTAQLTAAAPFAMPDLDPEIANLLGKRSTGDSIEVGGIAQLHRNILKKRAINPANQMDDTNRGWAGGIEAGNDGLEVVNRREIREFYNLQGGRVYDLYILALRRTMDRSGADKNSWWQLAGIHGRPFTSWNNRAPGPLTDLQSPYTNTGYCTHGSTLFPTWHRPYLAYYEEVLWASAYLEINKVKDAKERVLWENALLEFRIPYWDWGLKNAEMPSMVRNSAHTWRFFPNVKNIKDAPPYGNPLYTFFFKAGTYDVGNNFGNDRFRQWRRTLRHPRDDSPGVGDNIGAANTALTSNGNNIRQQVHELLLRSLPQDDNANIISGTPNSGGDPARWGAFSNRVGNSGASVESIHDGIHVWCGGDLGHMSSVPYSSFDPIFFLHHTNVDRLFALYQGINPKNYVTPQRNGGGTYGINPDRTDTSTSYLEPFVKRGGGRLNSNDVKDTRTFGYGYADVPKHLYPNSPTGLRRYVMGRVHTLYGNAAVSSSMRKRDTYDNVTEAIDNSIVDNKYYEWRVDVVADRAALGGSYTVHFFLGKPNRDYKKWIKQPEFVGDYVVFTHSMTDPVGTEVNNEITGSVPLTDAMVYAFGNTNLTSLNPQDAIPFLIRRLRWRVTDSNGVPVRARDVKGLKVSVSISHSTLPTAQVPWTRYGEWTFLTEITRKIGRDGGPDRVGIPNLVSSSSTASPTTTSDSPDYATEAPTSVATTTDAATTEAPTSVAEDVETATPTSTEAAESSAPDASSTSTGDASSPTDD
ncbi:hypothetical protein TWF281_000057 [Arthrobotrys megalospora]